MPYRRTPAERARREQTSERILAAARQLVATGGFGSASVAAVAEAAGMATGNVYRYFPSKAALSTEVFRRASQREVDEMAAVADQPGPASERLERALRRFCRRALRGRTLAYALIAEPVDPAVESERLVYRRAYAAVIGRLIQEGIAARSFPLQDVAISAACTVGALAEALVGPLSQPPSGDEDDGDQIDAIVRFCLRAVSHNVKPSDTRNDA